MNNNIFSFVCVFVHLQVKSHTSTTVFLLVMHSKYAKELYSVSSWPHADSICLLMDSDICTSASVHVYTTHAQAVC